MWAREGGSQEGVDFISERAYGAKAQRLGARELDSCGDTTEQPARRFFFVYAAAILVCDKGFLREGGGLVACSGVCPVPRPRFPVASLE